MNIRLITLTLISTVTSHCIANPSETTIRERLEKRETELTVALDQTVAELSKKYPSGEDITELAPQIRKEIAERMLPFYINLCLTKRILRCMNEDKRSSQECLCEESYHLLQGYRKYPCANPFKVNTLPEVEMLFPQIRQELAHIIFNPENNQSN